MLVSEEHMPPVIVAVVAPLIPSVDGTLHNPWTGRVLCLVVDPGEQLLHVVVII